MLHDYKYKPRAPASNTSTLATISIFSAFTNLVVVPFSFHDLNQHPMAGEDHRGKHAAKDLPEEEVPVGQRLRHMR